jgi:hypothetical protein
VPWGAVLQTDALTTRANCDQRILIVADRHQVLARIKRTILLYRNLRGGCEELARRVNHSGIPMIPALLVRASALCHMIADLFIEQRASRKSLGAYLTHINIVPTASR